MTLMPFDFAWMYGGKSLNLGRTKLVLDSIWRVHVEGSWGSSAASRPTMVNHVAAIVDRCIGF